MSFKNYRSFARELCEVELCILFWLYHISTAKLWYCHFWRCSYTETVCAYTETGNIKCSLSKIYETAIQIQENPKGNRRKTQPKHKIPEEKQRKTMRNMGK